jgi:choline dehydrogenase-like flavoprotein
MINVGVEGQEGATHDICVVGSGPVGISLALELARLGRSVLLLESGDVRPSHEAQQLADAYIVNSQYHVAMDIAMQRSLGGASNLWGGRCVPLSPIDFQQRSAIPESGWPISATDLDPFIEGACFYLGCGRPVFTSAVPELPGHDPNFRTDELERWCVQPKTQIVHHRTLRDSQAIDVRLRATVTGFEFASDGRVAHVLVSDPTGKRSRIRARGIVLAAGGLENARLLLAAQTETTNRFGGERGPLGRYYMGHLYGSAAEVIFHSTALDAGMDYFQDTTGYYVRRRFTPTASLQQQMGLTNAALWPEFPAIHDPAHRNGILSFAWLSLAMPWIGRRVLVESIRRHYVGPGPARWWPHLSNMLHDLPAITTFIPAFVYRRYLARYRMPGFFQRNPARRYALRFHAEQLPDPESRVGLMRQRDALDVPRLAIDFRYSNADALPLLRTHASFGSWLETTGLGKLIWQVPEEERIAHILGQCYDGHHQIGITRMGVNANDGVVDANCRVFGAQNLFIAGSSVFRTSAAANPTLSAVGLALRLATYLAREIPGVTA